MKKLFLTILIVLITISTASAKIYYFKDLKGIVESTATGPFDSSGGETSLDVSVSFNKSSLYIIPGEEGSISYTLSGEDADSITLKVTSSNESILSASDIIIDNSSSSITIPSSSTSSLGELTLTLSAMNGSNTVISTSADINISYISANNMLTKWTVSAGETVTFPTSGSYFNQTFTGHIDWGDDSEVEAFTSVKLNTLSHTYTNAGTYDIKIDGDFYGLSNASHIFRNIGSNISSIDISTWNMSNVTDASYLFQGYTTIPEGFDISWNNFTPTTIYGAFWSTTAAGDLDLSSWDTSNVTNIGQTFRKTILYGDLNLSGWDLSNVTTYGDFISGITVFNGDIIYDKKVSESAYSIFLNMLINGGLYSSTSGQKIYVGDNYCSDTNSSCLIAANTLSSNGWTIVSNHSSDYVINDNNMLTKWTVSAGETITFPTSGSYFNQTFTGHIDWGDNSEVEAFASMKLNTLFHTYTNAGTYDIKIDGDFYGLSNASHIFRNIGSNISSIDISTWNMSNVTDASYLFQGYTTIPEGFDISWNNFTPTTIYGAFWSTTAAGDLDLSSWDTSNVTNIAQTFRKTNLYGDLNLSGWDLSNVTTYGDFISGITTFSGNFIYDETVSSSVYKKLLQMLISGGFPSSSSHYFYVGNNSCGTDTTCSSYENTITNKGWVITRTTAE